MGAWLGVDGEEEAASLAQQAQAPPSPTHRPRGGGRVWLVRTGSGCPQATQGAHHLQMGQEALCLGGGCGPGGVAGMQPGMPTLLPDPVGTDTLSRGRQLLPTSQRPILTKQRGHPTRSPNLPAQPPRLVCLFPEQNCGRIWGGEGLAPGTWDHWTWPHCDWDGLDNNYPGRERGEQGTWGWPAGGRPAAASSSSPPPGHCQERETRKASRGWQEEERGFLSNRSGFFGFWLGAVSGLGEQTRSHYPGTKAEGLCRAAWGSRWGQEGTEQRPRLWPGAPLSSGQAPLLPFRPQPRQHLAHLYPRVAWGGVAQGPFPFCLVCLGLGAYDKETRAQEVRGEHGACMSPTHRAPLRPPC